MRFASYRLLGCAALAAFGLNTAAAAGDIAAYGGQQFSEGDNFNTLAVSAGFDLFPLSPIELRSDFTYAFRSDDLGGFGDLDQNIYYGHVGPAFTFDPFIGFDVSVGAQAGVAVIDTELNGFDDTDAHFSYQFPVAVDFPIAPRFSIGARYRPLFISIDGDQELEHVLEGGIRFKF
ncbi:MAG: outer membrane beta-barrel protein [Pseudomonadota bacterium]